MIEKCITIVEMRNYKILYQKYIVYTVNKAGVGNVTNGIDEKLARTQHMTTNNPQTSLVNEATNHKREARKH